MEFIRLGARISNSAWSLNVLVRRRLLVDLGLVDLELSLSAIAASYNILHTLGRQRKRPEN